MNDVQWLEAARKLAERALLERAMTANGWTIVQAMLRASYRNREGGSSNGLLDEFREVYSEDPKAAAGGGCRGGITTSRRRASRARAWMLLASAAMNLDAAVNK